MKYFLIFLLSISLNACLTLATYQDEQGNPACCRVVIDPSAMTGK